MAKRAAVVLACLWLAGCGTAGPVADELTTFNEAQQKGNSQLLLINILRAREKQPLAFSRFDVLRGGIAASSSLGLSVPFGAGSAANNTIATGLGLAPGISQDVKPQEDQDFYRGILTPVSEATWALYQDQNWSQDLLFHLFVEDIKLSETDFETVKRNTDRICAEHGEVSDIALGCAALADSRGEIARLGGGCKPLMHLVGGKPLLEMSNDPGDPCRLAQFEAFTDALGILGFRIGQVTTKSDIGPALGASAFNDLKWPFALKDSNVEIARNGTSYQFRRVSSDYEVSLSNMPCPARANVAVAATSEIAAELASSAAAPKVGDCADRAGLDIAITTRSPGGMIYYMGEVARALLPLHPEQAPHAVMVRNAGGRKRALLALVADEEPDAATRVDYRGTTYSVPHGEGHLTMQAFELLQQVFALYNRASTTPSTTAVTVVP